MNDKSTTIPTIWYRWLVAVCTITTIFALLLVVAPGLFHSTLGEITYNSFFDNNEYAHLSDAELSYQDWMLGVLGATMIGWMLAISWLLFGPFRRGEQWSWNAITAAIVVWYILDTGTSLAHGVVFNAFFNSGFLFMFGIPLVATFRHFHLRAHE
jgi:hypothetical protein